MLTWNYAKGRCSRAGWFIPGLDYDVLVIRASDAYEDEESIVFSPRLACNMVGEWLEDTSGGGEALDRLLAECRCEPCARDPGWHSEIEKALESQQLIALKLSACSTRLGRMAARIEEAWQERQRRAREVQPPRRLPRRPEAAPNPLHRYAIHVMDDTGAPVAGVSLKLQIEDTPRMATTDANGEAVVEWFSAAGATVRVLEQAELEQRLEPRWAVTPSKALPKEPDIIAMRMGAALRMFTTPADGETTVVLERPGAWFEVSVVDELGKALGGVELALVHDAGRQEQATRADGRARFNSVLADVASVELVNADAVRKQVRPLWDIARSGEWVQSAPDTTVLPLSDPVASVKIEARKAHRLSVQPWVVRARLTGLHSTRPRAFCCRAVSIQWVSSQPLLGSTRIRCCSLWGMQTRLGAQSTTRGSRWSAPKRCVLT